MSLRSLLTHTCTITPRTISDDALGNEVEVDGTAVTGVPCRLDVLTGDEMDRPAQAVVATHRLFLESGTAIAERSAVTAIADAAGTSLAATADVEFVQVVSGRRLMHHQVAYLKEVRNG